MENKDLIPGLERMIYPTFLKKYTVYRSSQIGRLLIDLTDKHFQLPNLSSLHTINHFLDPNDLPRDAGPDLDNPVLRHEQWMVYLKNILEFATPESQPLPLNDRFIWQGTRYKAIFQKFFNSHKKYHRLLSDTSMVGKQNILIQYDYTVLQHARFTGRFTEYRRFEAILKTMLDYICALDDNRHHYIQFPLSSTVYSRQQFVRAYKKVDTTTLRVRDDPSYFLEFHLLAFAMGCAHPSEVEGTYSTPSAFLRVPDPVLDRLNIILTHDDKAVIFNLGDLKEEMTSDSLFLRFYRHINILKLAAREELKGSEIEDLSDDAVDEHIQRIDDEQKAIVASEEKPVITDTEPSDAQQLADEVIPDPPAKIENNDQPPPDQTPQTDNPEPVAEEQRHLVGKEKGSEQDFVDSVKENLAKHLENTEKVSTEETTQSRVDKLYRTHMNVQLGGVTIGELVQEAPDPHVVSDDLNFLDDRIPSKSQTQSSIAHFDKTYLTHMYKRDLAKVLTAFVSQGMFIADVKEEKVETQFDRMIIYRVRFIDHNGKVHPQTIKLPFPDENGIFLINGNKSRLIKQMANLPICKVSPIRVNLSSNYNKTLVERTKNVRNNYRTYITDYLNDLKNVGCIKATNGRIKIPHKALPYEYSQIAQSFADVSFGPYQFTFDLPNRLSGVDGIDRTSLLRYERRYGVFCGIGPNQTFLFWDMNDVVHEVSIQGVQLASFRLTAKLHSSFNGKVSTPKMCEEWTDIKILSKVFPVGFILGFQFGLSEILKNIKFTYRFVPKGERTPMRLDEIKIPFADGSLIYSRYPLQKSLIITGLSRFDTKDHTFAEFDTKDVYYTLLIKKKIETNYLKGVGEFFRLFVDPKTRDRLIHMHEPTNVKDLLLRATEMLSTLSFKPASSMAHHCMRGYERMTGIMYNEIARQYAEYSKQRNANKTFSINPEAVFQRIIGDQTFQNIDEINPVHEMKQNGQVTYSGSGGRTSQSFVVEDRQYPDDGVGFMSEATPDSGKVAMTAYTSADPGITSMLGTIDSENPQEERPATKILSTVGNLMPCVTQDDSKRAGFTSTILSHHVPCEDGEVCRVRTGYELTMAHRTSSTFAAAAKENGTIIEIDDKNKIVKIKYDDKKMVFSGTLRVPLKDKDIQQRMESNLPITLMVTEAELKTYPHGKVFKVSKDILAKVFKVDRVTSPEEISDPLVETSFPKLFATLSDPKAPPLYAITLVLSGDTVSGEVDVIEFGEKYTQVSGSYLKQNIKLNVHAGEKVRRGDILAYNSGFFRPDPFTKQVGWKHGVMANVALMDMAGTLEDGSLISKEFGDRMKMAPAHIRSVPINRDTALQSLVDVGEDVETTDIVCIFEEGSLDALGGGSADELEWLSSLNRQSPRAKFHGRIAKINVYYACDFGELHPTIQKVVRKLDNIEKQKMNARKGTIKEGAHHPAGKVDIGLRYHGYEFDDMLVLIEFTIVEEISAGQGDKLCIANANKTVISQTMEKAPYTLNGRVIDLVYACTGAYNRIVNSIFRVGMVSSLLEKGEQDITKIYFG